MYIDLKIHKNNFVPNQHKLSLQHKYNNYVYMVYMCQLEKTIKMENFLLSHFCQRPCTVS